MTSGYLCDVRKRLPACCTTDQVFHSLVKERDFFFPSQGTVKEGGEHAEVEYEFEYERVVNPIFKFIFKLQLREFERSTGESTLKL
jgi:hypothetical protein